MGVQIVSGELKMGRNLLEEVDDAALHDVAPGRTTLEENKTEPERHMLPHPSKRRNPASYQ